VSAMYERQLAQRMTLSGPYGGARREKRVLAQ
jgi:hypothetical protein